MYYCPNCESDNVGYDVFNLLWFCEDCDWTWTT